MKNKFLLFTLIIVFLVSFIQAANISDKIRLNGFLSQGYVKTWNSSFIPNSEESGSFEMNELGMTLSVQMTDKLRFGFQLLARDFGPWGNNNVQLDWGFADYHFSDSFGIRVGKIKTPMGLFNEIRDTDALRPMALLPQSVYDEYMRSTIVAYNGFGIYGNLPLSSMGDLQYDAFAGTVHHPNDASYIEQVSNNVNTSLNPMGLGMTDLKMDTKSFLGGRLIWNTPLDGLRFSGTYIYFSAFLSSNLTHPLLGKVPSNGFWKSKGWYVASFEYVIGNFTLTAEYMELPVFLNLDILGNLTDLTDLTTQGYYIMGSYMFGDKLTLSAFYDQYYSDKKSKDSGFQKDLAIALRYDFNMNWIIKLEWHSLKGNSKADIFSNSEESNWDMLIIKSSYTF